jgi:cell division inhibitor SulA
VAAEAAGRGARQLTPKAAELSPVEALEEALHIAESEPLRAVELAVQALRGLNHTFEVSSLESALRAHRARLQLESGEGLKQAVRELKADLTELLAHARRSGGRL